MPARSANDIVFLVNPRSGGEQGVKLFKVLRDYTAKNRPGDIVLSIDEIASTADFDNIIATAKVVVVAGGDGTISSIATMYAEAAAPFALIPLGTGNDLAKELGVSTQEVKDVSRFLRWLDEAVEVQMPVWEARWGEGDEQKVRFINYFSIGYDAAVVRRFSMLRSSFKGKQSRFKNRLMYALAALEKYCEPSLPAVRVQVEPEKGDLAIAAASSRALFFTNISSVMGLGKFSKNRLATVSELHCFNFSSPLGYLRPIIFKFVRLFAMHPMSSGSSFTLTGQMEEIALQYDGEDLPAVNTEKIQIHRVGSCRLLAQVD
jgi:diacylglycerol kinase family enzyme